MRSGPNPMRAAALAVALLGGLTSPLRAREAEPPAAQAVAHGDAAPAPNGVVASVTHGPEGFEVDGRFRVAAPPEVVWAVLTDYEAIPKFVSSMHESRIRERSADRLVVEQVAVARLFLFKRQLRTTLEVREAPPGLIRFEDIQHQDFERYQGE